MVVSLWITAKGIDIMTLVGVQQPLAAGPFLKWAGGKNRLLPQLEPFFPERIVRYHEPFVGSGAVFFYLRRTRGAFPATLLDSNAELINCFTVVRDRVDALLPLLRWHEREHSKRHYYAMREHDPGALTDLQRAARFIYLNKTCYNGLYRVNAKGQFNVPMGSYKNPRICDEAILRAASEALQGVTLLATDFSTVLDHAGSCDFVYFDPPHYTESSGFTGYAVAASGRAGFGAEEHRRLAEVVKELDARGCHVIVSNSDTAYTRHLYTGFRLAVVRARRMINCNGAGRGLVDELVVSNR